MNRGMLDFLGAPVPADDDEQIHQFQAVDPFRAMAHAAYSGGTLAGKGIGRIAATAAGADPRMPAERNSERQNAAANAVRAAVAGLKPGTDEYFAAVTKALNEHGLVQQAMAIQTAWEEQKLNAARKGAYDRQHQPKPPTPLKGKDALLAKYDEVVEKLVADPDNPQLLQMRSNIETALKTFYPEKAPKSGEWKLVPPTQDSPGYMYHTGTGEEKSLDGRIARPEKPTGLTPAQQAKADDAKNKMKLGYDSAALKAQADYDAAVALYNHKDLESAVGPLDSILADTNPAERGLGTRLFGATKSAGARNAAALIQTVKAGAFLTGFQEIKQAASAAGASGAGFGALSDAEGARIQAAKSALDAAQDAAEFRGELAKYIAQMVESWNAVSEGAKRVEIAPRPIVEKPLTGGSRTRSGRVTPAPAPRPAAPVAPKQAPSNIDAILQKYPPKN